MAMGSIKNFILEPVKVHIDPINTALKLSLISLHSFPKKCWCWNLLFRLYHIRIHYLRPQIYHRSMVYNQTIFILNTLRAAFLVRFVFRIWNFEINFRLQWNALPCQSSFYGKYWKLHIRSKAVLVAFETLGAWVQSSLCFIQEVRERMTKANGDKEATYKLQITSKYQHGNQRDTSHFYEKFSFL